MLLVSVPAEANGRATGPMVSMTLARRVPRLSYRTVPSLTGLASSTMTLPLLATCAT